VIAEYYFAFGGIMPRAKRAKVNKRVEKQDEIKLKPTRRTVGVKPAKPSKEQRRNVPLAAVDRRNVAGRDERPTRG
jgi:hypothetical protein